MKRIAALLAVMLLFVSGTLAEERVSADRWEGHGWSAF